MMISAAFALAATLSPASQALPAAAFAADSVRVEVEQGIRDSEAAPLITALERNYPEDATQFVDNLLHIARSGGSDVMPLLQELIGRVATILRTKADDVVNAPAADLLRVVRLRVDLLEALEREDVVLCGRMIGGGAGGMYVFPPTLRGQSAAVNAAIIDAGGAGRRGPRLAGRGEVRAADAAVWGAAIRQRDPGARLAPVLASPAALGRAEPALQCRAGIVTLRALLDIPPESAGNIAAFMFGQELRHMGTDLRQ